MADRPILTFDGQRYERHKSTWCKLATDLLVPVNESHALDIEARRDAALWERCRKQDFLDDKRNAGRLWLGKERSDQLRDLTGLKPSAPADSLNVASTHRHESGRRARTVDDVHVEWHFNRGQLVLKCDLEGGWRETASRWCFRASARVELPGASRLRVTVSLNEDTMSIEHKRSRVVNAPDRTFDGLSDLESVAPHFGHFARLGRGIRCEFDGPTCTLVLDLLDEANTVKANLPWASESDRKLLMWKDNGFYENPFGHGDASISRPFVIQVDGAFHDVVHTEPMLTYERDTPLPSAGLPSLGKRR